MYDNLIARISVVAHFLVYGILAYHQYVTSNQALEKLEIMYYRQVTYDNNFFCGWPF